MQRAWTVGWVALTLLAGCGDDPARSLFVDLKTDFVPELEFDTVRTTVVDLDGEPAGAASRGAALSDDFVRGERVAEVAGLTARVVSVSVALDHAGVTRIERPVRVTLSRDTAITVVITRDCRDEACPGPGDPANATSCVGGACVAAPCTPETPEECPDAECADDDECAVRVECAGGRCEGGVCLEVADHDRCGEGMLCSPDDGCVPVEPARDAGRPDAGDACVPADCDDGNPCTDDGCGPEGCQNIANAAPCDDGVFCNGADTCAGGSCSAHVGDPCPGASVCDAASDTCMGCADDGDCPEPIVGPFGACSYAGPCDEDATRSRTITRHACAGAVCVPSVWMQSEACTRSTAGMSCGATACAGFGPCAFDDVCDEDGTRSRVCTDRVCAGGACTDAPREETEVCVRDTEGTTCGSRACPRWGPCAEFSDTCDESGTERRTCTLRVCGGGRCNDVRDPESRACGRSTERDPCETRTHPCGTRVCRICQDEVCVVNAPHFEEGTCVPSCGQLATMCGGGTTCCPSPGTCAAGVPGASHDCDRCCSGTDTCL